MKSPKTYEYKEKTKDNYLKIHKFDFKYKNYKPRNPGKPITIVVEPE